MKSRDRFLLSSSTFVPKIMCFLLSCFIVISLRFLNINDRVIKTNLSVLMPDGLEAQSNLATTVDVVITGDDSVIYLVDPSEIRAYVDFSDVKSPGIAVAPVTLEYNENVFKSDAITVVSRPSSIRVLFEEALSQ